MIRALAILFAALASPAMAVDCRDIDFDGAPFTICEVDASRETLSLFLNDDSGAPYGHFSTLRNALSDNGQDLIFAMNAGMYHDDRSPVGHYVENGVEQMRIIPNAGPGNFGLLPNGVFCIRENRADVFETLDFRARAKRLNCTHATQSGPMLVIDGALHPRFKANSTSRYVRNGVGTSADGTRVVFAISNIPVSFHHFGRLFRDHLALPDALYFDGNISRIYTPTRHDLGWGLGPIVGVSTDK